jgi:phage recombination protein Bet
MEFTEQELKAIRSEFCRGFTDEQFQVCMTFCRIRNLMPGKHVVFTVRKSSEWDAEVGAKVKTEKIVFITTIDAARLIAQRTKEYVGQAPEQYVYLDGAGMPTLVSEIPLPDPSNRQLPREPWAVRTSVYRKGFDHPITSVARFDAYAVTRRSGDGVVLTEMWSRRAPEMLAKCCEMLSLRKAFPEELSGMFVDSEFKPELEDEKPHVEPVAVVTVPGPLAVPAVDQTPATPTNTPRPHQDGYVNTPALPGGEVTAPAKTTPEKPARKPRAEKKQPPAEENRITDEDVEAAMLPTPPEDKEKAAALAKEVESMVESASSFTEEEIAAKGLPAPADPIPSKEEMNEIIAKIREISAGGISNQDLKEYFLYSSGKPDPKLITKSEWVRAFEEFHKAKLEGRAKEFVKERN